MKINELYQQKFEITDAVYQGFIRLFCDRNPLHTDLQFAQSKGFGAEVMHGNILCGFLSFFIGECLPVKNVIIHSQEIKFYLPVYLYDTLELNVEITGFFESVNVYEFKYFFENQENKKVAKGKFQIGILP